MFHHLFLSGNSKTSLMCVAVWLWKINPILTVKDFQMVKRSLFPFYDKEIATCKSFTSVVISN